MRRTLLIPLAALLLVACAPAPAPTEPSGNAAAPPESPAWASEMLARVNAERAKVGRAPLVLCATLTVASQRHSDDQAAHSTMSHRGSNGSSFVDRVQAAGYTGWSSLAENVAAGYRDVDSVMDGWMGSDGHRANLLASSTRHVGVGRAAAASGTLYWTQNFGSGGSC